jgi:hypothetical protein
MVKDLYVYVIAFFFPEAMRYADITVTRREISNRTKDTINTERSTIGNSISYSVIV